MRKLLSILLAVCLCLTLALPALAASDDYQGGSSMSMGSGEASSGEPAASVYVIDGELTQLDADEAVYSIGKEPTVTEANGVITIDGLEMAIHDFTANGVSVVGGGDTVVLKNANITKFVEGPISGNAGGYVAGTTGGTLYIVDSVLTEDGRGGVGGNYTAYASAGSLVVENSSIIQLGEEEGGYTSNIGEPGSNGGLLVYGYARANMSIGTSHTYYFDSYVETEGWAAMSTDAGRGVEFYSYNSTARAVNGGYGVYADNGCYDYMYGTALMGAEMGAIIAGGGEVHLYSTDYAGDDLLSMQMTTEPAAGVRGLVLANRTGIMIHSPDEMGAGDNGNTTASTFEARGVDFVMTDDMDKYWQQNEFYDGASWEPQYQDYSEKYDVSVGEYIDFIRGAAILVKSTSANIDLDDVTFTCENGTSEGGGTILMSAVNSDNHGRWVKASQDSGKIYGTVANIANSEISGDIKDYDYQRKMTVNLDNTTWTGALYTWDADTWDAAWTDECKAADRCLWILGEDSYNRTTQGSTLNLANGSVWNVTDESQLVGLTVDAGSVVNGIVTVDGQPVDVSAGGSWTGEIVVTPAAGASSEVSGEAGGENTVTFQTVNPFAGEITVIVTYTGDADSGIELVSVIDPDLNGGEDILPVQSEDVIAGLIEQVIEIIG